MITQCFTIGRRPDLLRQTLESQNGELARLPCLAINDFGDRETSEAFRELRPEGRLVGPDHHLGHHGAIDFMYEQVETPYIFQNEDDWYFDRSDFLGQTMTLLNADDKLSCICVRSLDDMPLLASDKANISIETLNGIRFAKLDHLHPQWHGFTFNPCLMKKTLWSDLGGYSGFKKERHISRKLRADGFSVAFLQPGACHHIGEERSVSQSQPNTFKRFKNWIRRARHFSHKSN